VKNSREMQSLYIALFKKKKSYPRFCS